jgi:peptide-methionine (S)-S-oxide reductase
MNKNLHRHVMRFERVAITSLALALGACGIAAAEGQVGPLPEPQVGTQLASSPGMATAVVAGGCFWGVQGVFSHVKGVISATSGYSGGPANKADYETVSTGTTGHAESVKIVYDPSKVSYGELLRVFFSAATNPTELNRQGPDTGTQYRNAIFVDGPEQTKIAQAYIKQLSDAHVFKEPIVTEVSPLKGFYPAEAYHQDFLARNPHYPYIVVNDLPKVAALKSDFPTLYR